MIYAIVMAGGRGTRLKVDVEKPLFKLHGKPLIKYVLDNISSSISMMIPTALMGQPCASRCNVARMRHQM